MKSNFILLFIFFFLISINKINGSSSINIYFIPDANHNATAPMVFLNNIKESKYIFFCFDFNYHNQVNQNEDKDIAFFKLITQKNVYDNIQYTFLAKKVEKVTTTDLEPNKYYDWKLANFKLEKQNDNENYCLIEIKRIGGDIKGSTLIIRIPILKYKGEITIENINSFSDNKKKNVINNLPNNSERNYNSYRNERNYYHHYLNNHHHGYYEFQYGKHYYNKKKYYRRFIEGSIFGSILGMVWIFVFILYCLINRRKNAQLAIIIGNNNQ
jgi:hypothetical protein